MNMEKDENIKEKDLKEASKRATTDNTINTKNAETDKNGSREENSDTEADKQSAPNSAPNCETKEKADESEGEKDPLAEALTQVEALKDKYLRLMAEFDNYRRRTLRERTELILNGSEKAVQAMLPVVDDMERAIQNATKSDDITALKEGMDLIYQKLNKTLESLGVKQIDTKDADFDTDYHEAVAMVPGMGDDKKGKVLDCVQTGYTLNDKVIRHAKVAVGQ